jgi:hypothetical protein
MPAFGEQVGDRHQGRADDAEGMLDAVHLQDLHMKASSVVIFIGVVPFPGGIDGLSGG